MNTPRTSNYIICSLCKVQDFLRTQDFEERKKLSVKYEKKGILINCLLYGVFVFYIALLILILFRTRHLERSINLVPLRGIISFLSGNDLVSNKDSAIVLRTFAISNLVGNIVIFVPLGVYSTLFHKDKGIWKNTLLIMLVSTLVEIMQVIFKFGIGDIDDIILNSIGGFVGILIYRLLLLKCKDDLKVRRMIAMLAPIAGIVSFVILFMYNNRY